MSIHVHQHLNHSRSRSIDVPRRRSEAEHHLSIRVVCIVQIVGGLWGAGVATALLLERFEVLALVGLLAFLACVAAGVLLWQKSRVGYFASVALQLLQIPWITTQTAAYAFVCGGAIFGGSGSDGLVAGYSMMSLFQFGHDAGWRPDSAEVICTGINLVAVASVALLMISHNRMMKHFASPRAGW